MDDLKRMKSMWYKRYIQIIVRTGEQAEPEKKTFCNKKTKSNNKNPQTKKREVNKKRNVYSSLKSRWADRRRGPATEFPPIPLAFANDMI